MGIDVGIGPKKFHRILLFCVALAVGGIIFFASASSVYAVDCNGDTAGPLFDCPVEVTEKFPGVRYGTVIAGLGLHGNGTTTTKSAGNLELTIPACADGSTATVVKSYLHWFNRPDASNDYDSDILLGVDGAGSPTAVSAGRTYTHDDKDGNADRRAYVADITDVKQGGSNIMKAGKHTYNFSGFNVNEPYGFGIHAFYECADLPLVDVVYHEGNDFFWGRAGEISPPAPPEGIRYSELVCAEFDAIGTAAEVKLDLIIPGATPPSNAFPGRPRTAYLWWASGTGAAPDAISTVIGGTAGATRLGKVVDGNAADYAFDIFSDSVSVPAGDEYICVQLESEHPDANPNEYGMSGSLSGFTFSLPVAPDAPITQDWGDLPDTFDTRITNNGPVHTIVPNMYLGDCVDAETNGSPTAKAGVEGGGDDNANSTTDSGTCTGNDDEDGVTLLTPLIAGHEACLSVSATVPAAAILNGWIDFDSDGDFDGDASDQLRFNKIAGNAVTATTNGLVVAGTNTREYCFTVPATATFHGGQTHMRYRLSTAGSLSFNGPAADGEIEDYWLPLACVGNYVWIDPGGNNDTQDNPDKRGINGIKVDLVCGANRYSTFTKDAQPGRNQGDEPGKYHFCGLPPESACHIEVVTIPSEIIDGETVRYLEACLPNVGGDDMMDSDGTQLQVGGLSKGPNFTIINPTGLVTAESGACDYPGNLNGFPDAQDDLRYDFCFRREPLKPRVPAAIDGEFKEPGESQNIFLPLLRYDENVKVSAFRSLGQ